MPGLAKPGYKNKIFKVLSPAFIITYLYPFAKNPLVVNWESPAETLERF